MASPTPTQPAVPDSAVDPPWSHSSRIAFRFGFLYFVLYCVFSQIANTLIGLPSEVVPDPGTSPPVRAMVSWAAEHVFQYKQPLIATGSGSGDKVYDWVQSFCILTLALAGTALWTALDRRRDQYQTLYKWFRVFLRFALAGQLLSYGLIKFYPLQMPFPALTRLLERFGDFSPMGVLWSSIGASPMYERFAGSAEMLAGLLLIFPPTSMLGALVCLLDMIQVFALNMTYDVPVKLFSFHLLLMALVLLIADRRRLVQFCFVDRTVPPSPPCPLFRGPRANQIANIAQIAFGVWLIATCWYQVKDEAKVAGPSAPQSPLFGIWEVDRMVVDGIERAPLFTDYGRWRRLVFQFPTFASFQHMDDSFESFRTAYDPKNASFTLTRRNDPSWKGRLAALWRDPNHIQLDGSMGQRQVSMQLKRFDHSKMLLLTRGFNWVQDYPFNR